MRPFSTDRPRSRLCLVMITSITLALLATTAETATATTINDLVAPVDGSLSSSSSSSAPITGSGSTAKSFASGNNEASRNLILEKLGKRNLREQHLVGPLPWEKGHEPIKESYAGHFPIRSWKQEDGKEQDARMFYWFFPATAPKVKDPPLILWLQGGPGASSMVGLFYENGPIHANKMKRLERNPMSWANEYSMVFVDQPVGTGYSFIQTNKVKAKRTKTKQEGDCDDNDDDEDDEDDDVLRKGDVEVEDENMVRLDEDEHDLTAEPSESDKALEAELEKDQQNEEAVFQQHADKTLAFKIQASQNASSSSFTNAGFVKDQTAVTADMVQFLDHFYTRYPEQRKADLYIAGQSYAGKFIPSIAKGILDRNNQKDTPDGQKIPIKGLSLGNTMTDPISQIQIHADHAYYNGLINLAQRDQMRQYQQTAVSEIHAGRFLNATRYRGKVFTLFRNATGKLNTFDLRKGSHPMNWKSMTHLLNEPQIKDSLNIYGPRSTYLDQCRKDGIITSKDQKLIEAGRTRTHYGTDARVKKAMRGDIMRSVKPLMGQLLDQGIKVLAYQGIFDFRDGPAGSTEWIETLEWKGQKAFLDSERKVWRVGNHTAGYVNQVKGLTRISMLGGGHYTPMDEKENSLVLIQHLIDGQELKVL